MEGGRERVKLVTNNNYLATLCTCMYMLQYKTDLILLQRLVFLLIEAKHVFITRRDVERDHMQCSPQENFLSR